MVNRHRSTITSLGLYFFFAKPHANLQILLKSADVCGIILHNKITQEKQHEQRKQNNVHTALWQGVGK